jgi:cytochrome b pre-mRNA-processing protein 3
LPLNKGPRQVSLLSRIFGKREDDRAYVRPLWHRTVAIAREPQWYSDCGIADTVPGRFDAVTLVLALVLLRMEREPALREASARLTEVFVEDMDGQLRQSGVGDLVVGKHIGRLMSVLGGRLGAFREALPKGEAAVAEVVERNVTLREGADPARTAQEALALADKLSKLTADDILAARIER